MFIPQLNRLLPGNNWGKVRSTGVLEKTKPNSHKGQRQTLSLFYLGNSRIKTPGLLKGQSVGAHFRRERYLPGVLEKKQTFSSSNVNISWKFPIFLDVLYDIHTPPHRICLVALESLLGRLGRWIFHEQIDDMVDPLFIRDSVFLQACSYLAV